MAYIRKNLGSIMMTKAPKLFTYKTDDTIEDLLQENYFEEDNKTFDRGDIILVNIENKIYYIRCSSINSSTRSIIFEEIESDSIKSINGIFPDEDGNLVLTTTDIPEGINLYFTDERVSNNDTVKENSDDIASLELEVVEKMDLIKLQDKYSDTDGMILDQASQKEGQQYQAGDDFYLYNGVATGLLEDYSLVGGSGGGIVGTFNAPLYFTTQQSTDPNTYFDLSYDLQSTEEEVSNIVSSSTSPLIGNAFIYPEELGVEEIPAGIWDFEVNAKVDSLVGTTTVGTLVYLRTIAGVETLLFATETQDIQSSDFVKLNYGVSQSAFICNATDRLTVRSVYSTTRTANTTITAKVGGQDSAYLTTPLALRHNQLREVMQAGSGVLEGHISNVAQTIAGVKTFSSSPIVPAPTTDLQVATKKYVDDNGGGGGASYSVDGGIISNNATTPDSIIDISELYDTLSSDRTQTLAVSTDSLDITLDASWASGTAPTLTDYSVHIWADYNSGTQRYILDDATGSNISGAKRRVGSFITGSVGDIVPFKTLEKKDGSVYIWYDDEIVSITLSNTTPKINQTLTAPLFTFVNCYVRTTVTAVGSSSSAYTRATDDAGNAIVGIHPCETANNVDGATGQLYNNGNITATRYNTDYDGVCYIITTGYTDLRR